MIEFEDPEAKYDFENIENNKKNNPKIKIRVVTMFVIFLMVVLMLARNDFDFNFMKTSLAQVPHKCDPLYSYNPHDSQADMIQSAEHVIKENAAEFAKIEGFLNAFVANKMLGEEGDGAPEILLEFGQVTKSEVLIPQKLCGFKVTAVYK